MFIYDYLWRENTSIIKNALVGILFMVFPVIGLNKVIRNDPKLSRKKLSLLYGRGIV